MVSFDIDSLREIEISDDWDEDNCIEIGMSNANIGRDMFLDIPLPFVEMIRDHLTALLEGREEP